MHIKTLLNHKIKFKGFVFQTPSLEKKEKAHVVFQGLIRRATQSGSEAGLYHAS